ncbi:hypothetical protein DS901_03780 [Loktanella sp. D2R18]|uniref:DUF1127 domain-containing protein n=1 Tax=Rhodobacterales TaxID=204455 RepID=UPI000DE8DA5D|nr:MULTISPECIES: DUF1127 domain-containing protein [Rhodobacterales]RBW45350.1 hypothetical protein DS901_03780 [Loktanella sp. D2R18]
MMSHALNHTATCHPRQRVSLLAHIITAFGVARQRHQLRNLDDRLLRDVGITRAQAMQEASKAPWDAPQNWKNGDI